MSTEAEITGVEFYWRPGCGFCARLDSALGKAGIPMNKHNIWEDDNDRDFVRSVADGNETVPTVQIGVDAMVNPSPAQVIESLRRQAPHLVPDGADEPKGLLGRLRGS